MKWLKSLYPEIRETLDQSLPRFWPGLRNVVARNLEAPIAPEAMLPLAACKLVNGQPALAVPIAAAVLALGTSLRVYDDIYDRDRDGALWQKVGPERAWNYASAVHVLSFEILSKASLPYQRFHRINQLFIDSCFTLSGGQDRDLAGDTRTIEDYWLTIEMKSGCAFALACAAGAMVGTDNAEWIGGCRSFGHHLGLTIQVFNDLESIWRPDGLTDLKQGKVTLPLVYGMTRDHPCRDELVAVVNNGRVAEEAARIKEILDGIDTRDFMIWAALKERDEALEALAGCPEGEGKDALVFFITGMFGDTAPQV